MIIRYYGRFEVPVCMRCYASLVAIEATRLESGAHQMPEWGGGEVGAQFCLFGMISLF